MSYRLVRVNTPDHSTPALAFDDMVSIIERGFYWKQSQLPDIPSGTQMIGMGSHGGRGLFIVGVTASDEWQDEPDGDVYKHRLPVAWARVRLREPVHARRDQGDSQPLQRALPGRSNTRGVPRDPRARSGQRRS